MCKLCELTTFSPQEIKSNIEEFRAEFSESVFPELRSEHPELDESNFKGVIDYEYTRKKVSSLFYSLASSGIDDDSFVNAIWDILDNTEDPFESIMFELSARFNKKVSEHIKGAIEEGIEGAITGNGDFEINGIKGKVINASFNKTSH